MATTADNTIIAPAVGVNPTDEVDAELCQCRDIRAEKMGSYGHLVDEWRTRRDEGHCIMIQAALVGCFNHVLAGDPRDMADGVYAAAEGGHTAIMRYLRGLVSIRRDEVDCNYALQAAAAGGHQSTMELAIAWGATDIAGAIAEAEKTAAADESNYARTLARDKAGIKRGELTATLSFLRGRGSVLAAAGAGQLKALQTLYANGIHYVNDALIAAASNGHSECVQQALDWGANAIDAALTAAAKRGMLVCMALLRKRGSIDVDRAFRAAVKTLRVDAAVELYGPAVSNLTIAWANLLGTIHRSASEWRRKREQVELHGDDFILVGDTDEAPSLGMCAQYPYAWNEAQWCDEGRTGPTCIDYLRAARRLSECVSVWLCHRLLLEIHLALKPLGLPLYVAKEVLDWAVPGPLSAHKRVTLLQGINESLARLGRESS